MNYEDRAVSQQECGVDHVCKITFSYIGKNNLTIKKQEVKFTEIELQPCTFTSRKNSP